MTIPAGLKEACKLRNRVESKRAATDEDEKKYRQLLLQAVAAGATRAQIQASCGIKQSALESEIRKARQETDDPKLRKVRLPHRGLTLGDYPCPTCGQHFDSSQATALHRVKMHDYRIGANRLTAAMVRKARADDSTPTRELARQFGVSHHALGAARSGRTWKALDRA